jgi:hypothetical protein
LTIHEALRSTSTFLTAICRLSEQSAGYSVHHLACDAHRCPLLTPILERVNYGKVLNFGCQTPAVGTRTRIILLQVAGIRLGARASRQRLNRCRASPIRGVCEQLLWLRLGRFGSFLRGPGTSPRPGCEAAKLSAHRAAALFESRRPPRQADSPQVVGIACLGIWTLDQESLEAIRDLRKRSSQSEQRFLVCAFVCRHGDIWPYHADLTTTDRLSKFNQSNMQEN